MFRQKLYRIIYSLLHPKLSEDEINVIRDRVYFAYLQHKQIPILENKKIKWIDMENIYYIKGTKNNILIVSILGKYVYKKLNSNLINLSEVMADFEFFIKCSNDLFINLLQIVAYNSYMQTVSFSDEVYIEVTQRVIKIIKAELGKGIDRYKDL